MAVLHRFYFSELSDYSMYRFLDVWLEQKSILNAIFLKHIFDYYVARNLFTSPYQKINFLILNQNICCGYSKEPSQGDGSFEHPKHMLKLMGKKIFTILRSKILFI